MKKKTKIILLASFLCIMFGILALCNKEIFIESAKVKTAQTLLSNELQIKDKTLNSVNISWGNIDVPSGTTAYNVYQDNQLVSNVTTNNYLFTNLNGGGTQYNFKIEYLDSDGNILLTKDINNITVASTITSFNQNATYSKDTYYIASDVVPTGVVINFESGSILKLYQGSKL